MPYLVKKDIFKIISIHNSIMFPLPIHAPFPNTKISFPETTNHNKKSKNSTSTPKDYHRENCKDAKKKKILPLISLISQDRNSPSSSIRLIESTIRPVKIRKKSISSSKERRRR